MATSNSPDRSHQHKLAFEDSASSQWLQVARTEACRELLSELLLAVVLQENERSDEDHD
jgi:hypothetical protein